MATFIWFIAIIVGIVSLVVVTSATVASVRAQKWALAVLNGVFLVSLLVAALWGRNPVILLVLSALLGGIAWWSIKRTTRNESQAEQVTKLSAAHITLLAGSLLFLIPFAWLISTSLKTDDEQAVFPPVCVNTCKISPVIKDLQ